MCGIAGIFHFDDKKVNSDCIRRMNDIAQHRGPDDEGFAMINTVTNNVQVLLGHHSDKNLVNRFPQISNFYNQHYNLVLAFRRLAIVDLSIAGHQPFSDESGNYWVTFNGEIYNYIELRNELQNYGFQFRTSSDTEVLLKAYIHWGEECISHFVGMFAFVIWDGVKQLMYGARDRFGVKPFNYYIDEDIFIWGSEEKQIIASGLLNFQVHQNSINRFFLLNQLHDSEETFVNNIKRIPSGHCFTIKNKKFSIVKYWDLDPLQDQSYLSKEDRIEKFRSLFTEAVKLRLRSDVPIGIALSGGLDSSSIAMISKDLLTSNVKTFSVYYEQDKKYDEREFIKAILDTGGFDPIFYTQDEQINFDAIRNWVFHQDGPTSGASPYSAYLNYKNVRKSGIIVLLNGQGGDEILAGYPYYFKYLLADYIKHGKFGTILKCLNQWRKDQSLEQSLKHLGGGILNLFLSQESMIKKETSKYCTTDLYLCKESFKVQSTFNLKFKSELKQVLYDTLKVRMLPHLLHWEDRNSMACSIESRVPFLDHRLVEFSFSLPDDEKIDSGMTKVILRKAMEGILPEKIIHRRDKKGFGTPTDIWTKGTLHNNISDLIHSKSIESRGIWNIKSLRRSFQENQFGENELWKIVTTELFIQEFEKLNTRN
ncbi:MAG: asparagine synthase (glutamine-hydrolyzing) [Saprospiraceae bacterium]|nr:asparagine synthase (glutamine-hydrolyzing) [Saprospiraceae bacterium]